MGDQPEVNPFKVPRRHASESPAQWTTKALAQWTADLPLVNIGETAKQLYQKLNEANRTELPFRARQQFLQGLLSPIGLVTKALERKFVTLTLPLSSNARKLPELSQRLDTRMASGYKIILLEEPSGFIAKRRALKQAQTTAAHHALYFYLQILMTCYELYEPAPKFLWKEIHNTYAYAKRRGLDKRPVPHPLDDEAPDNTVEERYKQILLMELAEPNRLQTHEIRLTASSLENWAAMARLVQIDDLDTGTESFVVEMDADRPPRHIDFDDDVHLRQVWILHTQDLAEGLGKHLADQDTDHPPSRGVRDQSDKSMPADLAEKLMLRWGVNAVRADRRFIEKDAVARVLHGMRSVYRLLQTLTHEPTQQNKVDKDSGEARKIEVVTPEGEVLIRDAMGDIPTEPSTLMVDTEIDNGENGDAIEIGWDDSRWATSAVDSSPLEPKNCTLFDHSAHGVQLGCRRANSAPVRIGAIIAVKTGYGSARRWRVGLIRWLRMENENTRYGVELFNSRPRPAMLERRRAQTGKVEQFPTLVVSRTADNHALIVMPATFIAADDRLVLVDRGERLAVSNVLRDEGTTSVTMLHLEITPSDNGTQPAGTVEPPPSDAKPAKPDDSDELDDLWTTL